MARKFTLGKNERLKSRKQIEYLFSEGKKLTLAPFRIHYSLNKSETASLQFGAGASSRTFKKAVDRNRIKRLMREAYRLQKETLQQKLKDQGSQLCVFFIYTGKEMPAHKDVYDKTGEVLHKLCTLIN
jgi:ribonuclease P protein component